MSTLFFDRTCGKKLPQALRLLGLAVEMHADHFAHDEQDDVWLAAVGARGWIVITNDKNIRVNDAERAALIQHGVGCFVLGSGSRTRWEQARILARAWDRMQEVMATQPQPFIFRIHADGRLEQLHPALVDAARRSRLSPGL